VQKQNTEHALMTDADTDRSLPTSMHSMLCYRLLKCMRRSSTTVTTSSETSLSCESNAGMLQRNHPRLHWMHTQHAMHPCITRQLSYRKEDHAMRPIYGCTETFWESSLRSRLLFQKLCNGLLFRSILRMCAQNLTFVALPVP